MSGETQAQESGWTIDTLKAHVDQRFDAIMVMLDGRYSTQTKVFRF